MTPLTPRRLLRQFRLHLGVDLSADLCVKRLGALHQLQERGFNERELAVWDINIHHGAK